MLMLFAITQLLICAVRDVYVRMRSAAAPRAYAMRHTSASVLSMRMRAFRCFFMPRAA